MRGDGDLLYESHHEPWCGMNAHGISMEETFQRSDFFHWPISPTLDSVGHGVAACSS